MEQMQSIAANAVAFLSLACKYFELQPQEVLTTWEEFSSSLLQQDLPPLAPAVGDEPQDKPSEEDVANVPSSEAITVPCPLAGWNHLSGKVDLGSAVWFDPRKCGMCGGRGDDDAGVEGAHGRIGCGRLLPMAGGDWIHANCAIWSSEVWEDDTGSLQSVFPARHRGSLLKCFGCGRSGATIGCSKKHCLHNYHFYCAVACGCVVARGDQNIFCREHAEICPDVTPLRHEVYEPMKSLRVEYPETVDTNLDGCSCVRAGSLTIHSFGTIESTKDGYHCKDYIFPVNYVSSRIFWSFETPRTRTLYLLHIGTSKNGALFSITPADNPAAAIRGNDIHAVYENFWNRVHEANKHLFLNDKKDDPYSRLPIKRKSLKGVYGLNGPQFFGIGLDFARRIIEKLPGAKFTAIPLKKSSLEYYFCHTQVTKEDILELRRERAALAAEKLIQNASGCARTEGMTAVIHSTGAGRITRALVRDVDDSEEASGVPFSLSNGGSSGHIPSKNDVEMGEDDSNICKYREMKSIPISKRLQAKRSHIHGWGLFTKVDILENAMIVEYMGEVVNQAIADRRELSYEVSGTGSCYMFRIDQHRIVDATAVGCMARFMNHCCDANAYAKVVAVDKNNVDKKIIVFANRDIALGEEITYDYKFPVEDGSLKCTCGAPNCIGRMN